MNYPGRWTCRSIISKSHISAYPGWEDERSKRRKYEYHLFVEFVFLVRDWQTNIFVFSLCFFFFAFFQMFDFNFRKQGVNIDVESRIIFSKWISKNLWKSSIWTPETYWLPCGSVNHTNVYIEQTSKREREGVILNSTGQIFFWWLLYILGM